MRIVWEYFTKAREWAWREGDPTKDRSKQLAVAGMIEFGLGLLSFALAMQLMVIVASTGLGGIKPVHFWMSMGGMFYLTAWFVVMGFGSLEGRRWARSMILVGAWVSIFFGTMTLALAFYVVPEALNLMDQAGVSPEAALASLYFAVVALVLLQFVFPTAAVLFYGMKSVRATCERMHPRPCWSDRVPLPLMAMGFVSGIGSLSFVFGASVNYVVFLFGNVVSGSTGMVWVALISLAFGYVGWGAFTRKTHAWWGAYGLVLFTSTSLMLTFAELDMDVLFERMGYSAEQTAELLRIEPLNPAMLTFVSCVWGVMACLYLVWTRDCFHPEKDADAEVKSFEALRAEAAEQESAEEEDPFERPRMRLDD